MSGPVNPQVFDRPAIEAHVSLIHDLAEGLDGTLILAAFEEGGQPNVQRFRIGDVAGMVETIMGFENHPSANLYAPWSVFRRDLSPGRKGAESDVVAVLAAVPDLDNDKYTLGKLPIEAPYIVETSPGNFQPIYIFDKPLAPADAKPVLAALSDFIGGDSGTKDCSHVWRIPGTKNIPTKSKLARGRSPVPAPVTIKKTFDGRFVSPAALLALAPPPRRPNGHDATPSGSLAYTEEARLRSALAVIPAEERDTWLKVGAALHLVGARAVWDDWSKTSTKFDAADQDRVWASFHGERNGSVITVATIYTWAKERGWAPTVNAHEHFLNGQAKDEAKAPQKPQMTIEWFGEAADSALNEPATPLVEDLLDEGGLSVIYGDSGSGKTFAALDFAFHVGGGLVWNGKKVRRGLVVYVAAEGGRRIKRRIAALQKRYRDEYGDTAPDPLFALVRYPIDLRSSDADLKSLLALVREAEKKTGEKCIWLIVDTLSRARVSAWLQACRSCHRRGRGWQFHQVRRGRVDRGAGAEDKSQTGASTQPSAAYVRGR
jgi:hypothetical protein